MLLENMAFTNENGNASLIEKDGFYYSPTAILKNVKVGKGTKIWHYVNAYGCEIGENSKIGAYVEIQDNVKIGNESSIQSHSFLCALVTIENNVFIGHGVKFINDVKPPTPDKTKWKPTVVKNGAAVGSNVTLMPVIVGENAMVGAGAVVTKDVPPNMVVVGNPARVVGRRIEDSEKLFSIGFKKEGEYVVHPNYSGIVYVRKEGNLYEAHLRSELLSR